jgi:hypothetical protein
MVALPQVLEKSAAERPVVVGGGVASEGRQQAFDVTLTVGEALTVIYSS